MNTNITKGRVAFALCLAFTTGCSGWSSTAQAKELWDLRLPGVNEGLVAGALPPPGVYGIWDQYWASFQFYNNDAKATGTSLDALIEIPIILWNPGIRLFGADYSAALAFPFDYTNLKISGLAATSANGHWGTFNTIIDPVLLSWSLPRHLYLKAGLGVAINDPSSSPAHPPSGGGVGSGNSFWSLQPMMGLSWLDDGWNLSVDGQYAYNFTDTATNYKTGGMLNVDYTATKTIGAWTVGLGAYSVNQLTADSGSGAASCAAQGGCKAVNYGLGPIVGYQFHGVSITADYNRSVYTKNDVGGNVLNVRLVVPFG